MAAKAKTQSVISFLRKAKKKNPGVSEKELWNKALKLYSGRPYNGKR